MKYKKKASLKFAITCILLSITPILFLGSAALLVQYSAGRQNIVDSMQQRAEMIGAAFDRMADNIESVSAHFSVAYMDGGVNDVSEIQKQFLTYTDTFSLEGRLFFYGRGEQTIYTSDGAYPYTAFESSNAFGSELNMISFFTRLNTSSAAAYLATRGFDDEGHFFVCMYPVPALSTSPAGMLFYIMDNESIGQMISDYTQDFHGYYAMFDSSRRLSYKLTCWDGHDSGTVTSALMALKGTQALSHVIDHEKFITIRLLSEKHGFAYTMTIPESVLFGELNRRTLFYGTGLLLLILLAVVLSLVAAHWQTKPLYQLAQSIDIDADVDMDGSDDLFSAMAQRFHNIQNENERLVLQIHSYAERTRARLLDDLIHGRIHDQAALDEATKTCGVAFSYPAFFIIVIQLQRGASPTDVETAIRLFGEVDFRGGKAFAFDAALSDMIGILVNIDEQMEQNLNELRRKSIDRFLERLKKLGFVPVACGVSRVRHSALRINQQLFEAIAALEWQEQGVGMFTQEQAAEQQFPFQECEIFRQSLLFGNEPAAMKTATHLIGRICQEHWATDRAQAVFFRLVNILLSVYAANRFPIDSADLTLAASGAQPEQVEAALREPIVRLCQMIEHQREQKEQKTNQAVIDYVYEHFAQADLSIETLAAVFQMSESAIRRILREATGMTLLNYVTTLRLAYVKKQLSETNRPIKEIVEAAGYIDVSSFTRKFKSIEGVTPGQYRSATQSDAPMG